MQLYELSQSSFYVAEAEHLIKLAAIIGKPEKTSHLEARAVSMRKLIADNLWDADKNVFVRPTMSFLIFWFFSLYPHAHTQRAQRERTRERETRARAHKTLGETPMLPSDDVYVYIASKKKRQIRFQTGRFHLKYHPRRSTHLWQTHRPTSKQMQWWCTG